MKLQSRLYNFNEKLIIIEKRISRKIDASLFYSKHSSI
jgi:hypothetical protein